ncbi:MAG: hypothetical protein K2O24_01785, partial [Muribaculaceae bacterium]|nr:hypothetical protein [Muribaculaceae bacterium]
TGWQADRSLPATRGYIDAALGSWLNSNLSAGYRILTGPATTLGVRLQHNSTSLWSAETPAGSKPCRRYVYDETLGADFSHGFKGAGRLTASAQYHLRCFNYYATLPYWHHDTAEDQQHDTDFKAPTQTLNDVSLRLGWTPESRGAFGWNLGTAYRHFGYRALYLPVADGGLEHRKGARENHIALSSDLSLTTSATRQADMGVRLDGVFEDGGDRWLGQLSLTPGYGTTTGNLSWRIGAEIDFTAHARSTEKGFPVFHIAPDLRASYTSGLITLFASASGGNTLQTLASRQVYDPYGVPEVYSLSPSYSPIDGKIGVTLNPAGGLRITVDAGYKVQNNVELGGWYQALLNRGAGLPGGIGETAGLMFMYNHEGVRLHGGRVGLEAEYDDGRILSIRGALSWQPQKGRLGWFNGYDRPRWLGRIGVSARPVSPLRIEASLDWRGSRCIYTYGAAEAPDVATPPGGVIINGGEGDAERYPLIGEKLGDIVDLRLGASWQLTKGLSVRAEAFNLLNRHTEMLPGLPSEGVCIAGGVTWEF